MNTQMGHRNARIIIVCEDIQHRTFLYRLLKELGFSTRRFRIEQAPSGKGSAEQWVRESYADEVAVYRRKSSHMDIGLIVMMDADAYSVQERQRELQQQLSSCDLARRKSAELISLLIPKRNIETWIYALQGRDVNERDAYPKLDRERDCQPAVDALVRHIGSACAELNLPSLQQGCQELQERLPK